MYLRHIKLSIQKMFARSDAPKEADEANQAAGKPTDDAEHVVEMQAQAQIAGAMENMAAAPEGMVGGDIKASSQDIKQYRRDYDEAKTVDEKRDALVSLIEVDAQNAATLLRDAYTDTDPELRKEAVLQMRAFNDQDAVIGLLLKALGDADAAVVIEAVEGLAHVRNEKATAGLKRVATAHPDEQIRAVAQDYIDQQAAEQEEKANE